MFGTKKKQRSALPEKQQLTKYYEMDGALRAYANRMALLGMTCGVFALGTLALFAYVRLQPPVVIRVDNSGEATVVGGDTVKVGANGLMGLLKVSANGPENSPGEVEGRAVVRKFLTSYLTYTPANVERQYADALNMMTLNFRQLTMNKFREDDILGKVKTDAITSSIRIRSIEPASGHAMDVSSVRSKGGPPAQCSNASSTRKKWFAVIRCDWSIWAGRRSTQLASIVGEFWEQQMVGEKDIDLDQKSGLLDRGDEVPK